MYATTRARCHSVLHVLGPVTSCRIASQVWHKRWHTVTRCHNFYDSVTRCVTGYAVSWQVVHDALCFCHIIVSRHTQNCDTHIVSQTVTPLLTQYVHGVTRQPCDTYGRHCVTRRLTGSRHSVRCSLHSAEAWSTGAPPLIRTYKHTHRVSWTFDSLFSASWDRYMELIIARRATIFF